MDPLRFPITKTFLEKKGSVGVASACKLRERLAWREIGRVVEFPDKQESGEGWTRSRVAFPRKHFVNFSRKFPAGTCNFAKNVI